MIMFRYFSDQFNNNSTFWSLKNYYEQVLDLEIGKSNIWRMLTQSLRSDSPFLILFILMHLTTWSKHITSFIQSQRFNTFILCFKIFVIQIQIQSKQENLGDCTDSGGLHETKFRS